MKKEAFTYLIKNYEKLVERIVYKYCRNSDDICDITSVIWTKTYTSVDKVQNEEDIPKWIARIAHNCCIDHLRKKRPNISIEIVPENDASLQETTSKQSDNQFKNDLLHQAINSLCDEDRLIIVLHHIKGESIDAISRKISISKSSAKVKLFRARERLRDYLVNSGYLKV